MATPKSQQALAQESTYGMRRIPDGYTPHTVSGIIDAVQDDDIKDKTFVASKLDEFKPADIGEIETLKKEEKGDYLHQVA